MTEPPGSQFPVDYAGPQTGYTFRPLKSRAKAAIICIIIVMVMELVGGGVMFLTAPMQEMADRKNPAESGTVLVMAGVIIFTSCLSFLTFSLAGIFHCLWIYRASQCAHAIAPRMEFSPGWAVGWFFIPILNLVRPYQVTRELWQVSIFDVSTTPDFRQAPVSGIVAWWWLCYLFSGVVGVIGSEISTNIREAALLGEVINLVGTLMIIAAGFLCIRIIRTITDHLESRNPNPQ